MNTHSIDSVANKLDSLQAHVSAAKSAAQQASLTGAFSAVSGLDQLGARHGAVLVGGPGGALDSATIISDQIKWISENLRANRTVIAGQDMMNSIGLEKLGQKYQGDTDTHPLIPQPPQNYSMFSFAPAAVVPPHTVTELQAQFATTNVGAATTDKERWETISTSMQVVADGLKDIGTELTADNHGLPFDLAQQRMEELSQKASTLSQTSAYMATTIDGLLAAHQQGQAVANSMQAALTPVVEPAEKLATEKSMLSTWAPLFQSMTTPAVPAIRHLVQPLPSHLASQVKATLQVPPQVASDFKQRVAELPIAAQQAFNANLEKQLAPEATPATFENAQVVPHPQADASAVSTNTASAGPGITPGGTANLAALRSLLPTSGAMTAHAHPNLAGLTTATGGGIGAAAGILGAKHPGAGSGRPFGGMRTYYSSPTSAGAGRILGGTGFGGSTPAKLSPAQGGGLSSTARSSGGSAALGGRSGYGVLPASQTRKEEKDKATRKGLRTSQVEQKRNKAEVSGTPKEVLPAVIGF